MNPKAFVLLAAAIGETYLPVSLGSRHASGAQCQGENVVLWSGRLEEEVWTSQTSDLGSANIQHLSENNHRPSPES